MQRIDPRRDLPAGAIPDFCRAQAILPLMFVMQLVATVLTLADLSHTAEALNRYVLISLYLQWLGLICAMLLCWLRTTLMRLPPAFLFLSCWAVLLAATALVSSVSWRVARWTGLPLIEAAEPQFLFSNLSISAIVAPLVLRYFWLQNQWREQVRAEGEARFQALHARIRPHFLFNSLNSVAALIATRPDAAERMVEDLSDLFRASLSERRRLAPLADELETVRAYLRVEQMRLGEKLRVEWELAPELMQVQIPPLSLQPLVENAVLHGVSRLRDGGTIRIVGRCSGEELVIEVENPLAQSPDTAPRETPAGSRTALSNIAQRLALVYGQRAGLELGEAGGVFRARLHLPLRAPVPEKAA